jgi:predicted NBD/HSP70 family sugar kinase
MLCCAGLFGGFILGAATGIPWMPLVAAGFGAGGGLVADIKIFRALEERKEKAAKGQPANHMVTCCSSLEKRKQKTAEQQAMAN